MAPRKTREVTRGLKRKGFQPSNKDHRYFYLYVEHEKTYIRTKVSHGQTEIDDDLLGAMARQLHLTRSQFDDLVICPLSGKQYISILRDRQIIS